MLIGVRVRKIGWRLRKAAVAAWGAAMVAGAAALIAHGWFPDLRAREAGAAPIAVAVVLSLHVLAKLIARVRIPITETEVKIGKADLELGAALVVALYATIALTGAQRSPVYPLVFALVAFLTTFHRLAVGLPLTALTLALEFLLYRAGRRDPRAEELWLSHSAFIAFFALVHALFLHGEMMRRRREHKDSIKREMAKLRQEARDFRLISSPLSADPGQRSRAADEERLAIGAVETIHLSLFYTLELLKKSLELHTCVLLWLDESGERLKIKELVTDSDCINEVPLPADAGALGTVVKNRLHVNLRDPKRGHLPYYATSEGVSAFLGVPVIEDGHLRGVLCADRFGGRPFTERDETLLAGAAQQMLRSLQSERVFAAVERSKYEHERFFAALAKLNRALETGQVCQVTFEATREICDFDFAAITMFDQATRKHTVVSATGEAPKGLDGLSFSDNSGLTSMVVKNKHFLPAGGEIRDKDAPVYTKRVRLSGMESLLVMPLVWNDHAIGSFAVAAKRTRAFSHDKREMLGVIANHVAVSLANAQMYGRMQEMATTDGLTGLVNHRTFQERIVEMLARADRNKGRHVLILTDIDHFKKVNDTHGHPVGDIVLKGVAHVVAECVRKVDVAARYGGEEFAIVLESAEREGALKLAERIREEVQKQQFQGANGPFSCTLSLGIAVYPDDARDKETLIANADQALYHAKHNGRNRAVAFADLHHPASKLKGVA